MDIKEINDIKERVDKTTLGPWKSFIEGRDHTSGSSFIRTSGDDIELSGATTNDQDFIAAARQDVPALIGEIIRLRKILDDNNIPY